MKSRFAPSPTGYLHIGGARTALFAWLWAKKNNSKFVLRIEDTDKDRSTKASTDAILDGMRWLDLDYDEGPIYQSNRIERYKEVISDLLSNGNAYYCDCSVERLDRMRDDLIERGEKPKYDGCCRNKNLKKGVVRFLNPDLGSVTFNDYVKGEIKILNSELDDLIILRSDGSPTYNFCVVVDDHDMGIECVIRGDDHINNTPKQINLYESMGWLPPKFAHVPMILGEDGSRLSKRHGALNLLSYRDQGLLPKALLNYIVRLGWSYGDQEIFSIDEMIKLFDLNDINNSPASFNQEKLDWINQSYLKTTEINELVSHLNWYLDELSIDITNGPNINDVADALRERSKSMVEMAQNCAIFYNDFNGFDQKQAIKVFNLKSKTILNDLHRNLTKLDNWTAENIHSIIKNICDMRGVSFGKVGQPFRLALSGDGKSGSIDITAQLIGKERTLARLKMAIVWINNNS